MGEAKRRRQSDPTFGQQKTDSWADLLKNRLKKISTLQLMLWILIIVSSVTTAVWSFNSLR